MDVPQTLLFEFLTFSHKPLDHLPCIILGALQKNLGKILTEWVNHALKHMLRRWLPPAFTMIDEYTKMTYSSFDHEFHLIYLNVLSIVVNLGRITKNIFGETK